MFERLPQRSSASLCVLCVKVLTRLPNTCQTKKRSDSLTEVRKFFLDRIEALEHLTKLRSI